MTIVLDLAHTYAERGHLVVPLHSPTTAGRCSCGEADCPSPGKHPRTRNGLTDGSADHCVIDRWWQRWPEANVGLRTGIDFDVIDLDSPDALDELDAAAPGAAPIAGPIVVTGRGCHLYVEATGRGNTAALLAGIDYRGCGGYVVAPPSHHPNGSLYSWADDHDIDTPPPPCPAWFLDLWDRRRNTPQALTRPLLDADGTVYGQRALDAELGRLATTQPGQRNDELVRAAFRLSQLVAGGQLNADRVVHGLHTVAVRIGLGDTEATRTIASGMKAGSNQPRRPAA